MSTKALAETLGKVAEWEDGHGLKYEVTITDSRMRWGNVDYLVTPVAGQGERWVSGSSVQIKWGW